MSDIQNTLKQAQRLAKLMDSAFTIPLINRRIGLDPLLGLLPGVGDAVGMGLSLYIVYLAYTLGMPRHRLGWMVANIGIDFVIGVVPWVGDLLDAGWKANIRNARMMAEHVESRGLKAMPEPGAPLPAGSVTIDVPAARHQSDKS